MAQKMRYIFTIYSIKRVVLCAAVNPRVNFKLAPCDDRAKVCDGWARNCDGWANARPFPPLATPLSLIYLLLLLCQLRKRRLYTEGDLCNYN